ncbi:MAG: hypothetical protein ABI574_00860 [Burkholderiales bacterium]
MIKPTVGRKLWYRPSDSDLHGPIPMSVCGSPRAGTAQPLDATVLAVWGDRCVNVLVLDIYGKPFTKTSVTLMQEDDVVRPVDVHGLEVYGYVEWMPYQTGQAKKEASA